MQAVLTIVTLIAFLVIGYLLTRIAHRLRIPEALLLILAGMVIGQITVNETTLVFLPSPVIGTIAAASLALIAFESTVRFRSREFDTFTKNILKTTLFSTIVIVATISIAAHMLFSIPLVGSIILAAILLGTSALDGRGILHYESLLFTPISLAIPFILLDFVNTFTLELITPALVSIVIGIGTGVFVGIILFKLIHHLWNKTFSSLAVIAAVLLSWVIAEHLGGNNVLAVLALGLFFAHAYAQHKISILSAEHALTKAISILVFLLVGIYAPLLFAGEFFAASVALFALYTALRFATLWILLHKQKSAGSLFALSLTAPKGIASAAIVLGIFALPALLPVAMLALACIIYSLLFSFIVSLTHTHENHPA